MFCSEWSLVKHEAFKRTITPLYCNAWTCDVCQPRRRKRLFRQAAAGHPNTFITLTANPAVGDSPEARARALVAAWRRVVRLAKAKYVYRVLPYLCVFEKTKKGEPHLHILARCKWIDQAWLSNLMADITGSPIVDVRRITSTRRVANYIAKYVGKEPHHFETLKRYWCTKDWQAKDPPDEYVPDLDPITWEISKWNWKTLGCAAEARGMLVTWQFNSLIYQWQPP